MCSPNHRNHRIMFNFLRDILQSVLQSFLNRRKIAAENEALDLENLKKKFENYKVVLDDFSQRQDKLTAENSALREQIDESFVREADHMRQYIDMQKRIAKLEVHLFRVLPKSCIVEKCNQRIEFDIIEEDKNEKGREGSG